MKNEGKENYIMGNLSAVCTVIRIRFGKQVFEFSEFQNAVRTVPYDIYICGYNCLDGPVIGSFNCNTIIL